ncbi:hypothetical protein [Sphingomonas astaxanthinifaciens]|uniref:Uncharacterized protein n=1 Tax=Sphingomonas astaxanthinifaciens DSM 22298 TaxID=1123267 RepID=A0ABQ5Z0R7_9SPHN|nr:hypothetical protein [Sphingomonas astaxanthinifaciens]GLR46334.1 hypothetical protein GCM10007925_00450 [Sphingomonas astaxanthinifaciens DSM 22298]
MSLALELLASAILLTLVTFVHGTGIALMDKLIRTNIADIRALRLDQREIGFMIPMALYLLALHVVEIVLFALFYLATHDTHDLYNAIYHSTLAYTTMGVIEGAITKWKLVSAFEGLAGFLMIGWSSAIFVTDMDKVLRRRS